MYDGNEFIVQYIERWYPNPSMHNGSDESSDEEGDEATIESARPALSLPSSSLRTVIYCAEVACEALKRLNVNITQYSSESNNKEPAANSTPSH